MRRLFKLLKASYDLFATHLLAWLLYLAAVAALLQLLVATLCELVGFHSTDAFWRWAAPVLPVRPVIARLVVFGLLHLLVYRRLRARLAGLKRWIERFGRRALRRLRRWAGRHPRTGRTFAASFSLLVTLMLLPLIAQPTIVPLGWGLSHWLARAANLADGTASLALVESIVGLYGRFAVDPVIGPGIEHEELAGAAGARALAHETMARWDPLIWSTVGRDAEAFALVKAVVWVESGGRQYAVSQTGCAGLMQFSSDTARSGEFRRFFGMGRVYPCRCAGACVVTSDVQRDLESGIRARVLRRRGQFACALNDARFDPRRNIAAGWHYLATLRRRFAGNLYLTYVAYNSGPSVSERISARIAPAGVSSLAALQPHLVRALLPSYGRAARDRATSLVRVHLPKLRRAFDHYRKQAQLASPNAAFTSRPARHPG